MKQYPAYKDSKKKSLGNIPSDWKVTRLKFCSNLINGYAFSSDSYVEDGIPIIRIGDIKPSIDLSKAKKVPKEFVKSHRAFLIQNGDILLALTGATIGKMAVYDIQEEALLNQRVAIIRPKVKTSNGFLKFIVGSQLFKDHIDYECVGGAQDNIGKPEIGEFAVVFPPLREQNYVGKYLDHKTHLIDTLIEKKQKQIELLQEQRAAIVNQAVTKGLNPNVKMKDSGIEWLGDIPKGWSIRRFKTLFEIKKRIAKKLGFDVLSITQEGIKIKDVESGEGQLSTDYSKYQLVQKGDYAMNQMDLLTGFVDISKFDGVTSPDYRVFVLRDSNCFPEYLLYFLQMGYINKLFFPFGRGAAHLGRWRLPTTAFNDLLAPCPPKEEQMQIAGYISAKTKQIDTFIDRNKELILNLKEYRTTLISEVVTGKIDIRDEAIP